MLARSSTRARATVSFLCPRLAANSFRNILPLSPCGSIFCPDATLLHITQLSEKRDLRSPAPPTSLSQVRLFRSKTRVNSLFTKILPLSPCGSRFYGDPNPPRPRNSFKTNILRSWAKKNRELESAFTPMIPTPARPTPAPALSPQESRLDRPSIFQLKGHHEISRLQ